MKRALFSLFVLAIFMGVWYFCVNVSTGQAPMVGSYSDITEEYAWAYDAIQYFSQKEIISGNGEGKFSPNEAVTREQFAKLFVMALDIPLIENNIQVYTDVATDRWSFKYIETARQYMGISNMRFEPERLATREEVAHAIAKAKGLSNYNGANLEEYLDYEDITPGYEQSFAIVVQRGYIKGTNGLLEAQKPIKRAEIAVVLYRAVLDDIDAVQDVGITGAAEVTVEEAKAWAAARGADERFIDIADLYWQYGELTGIRADVMYAQAGKETNYGKYTGRVTPEMNNWAGIKTSEATGDETMDHETFDTPETGVRAHFNHMSAYVGLPPIGETHDRYSKVLTTDWAGSVRTVFELGGKWAPAKDYGESVVRDYLNVMKNFHADS